MMFEPKIGDLVIPSLSRSWIMIPSDCTNCVGIVVGTLECGSSFSVWFPHNNRLCSPVFRYELVVI